MGEAHATKAFGAKVEVAGANSVVACSRGALDLGRKHQGPMVLGMTEMTRGQVSTASLLGDLPMGLAEAFFLTDLFPMDIAALQPKHPLALVDVGKWRRRS